MIKIALIFLLVGLQNPSPSSGKEGQPPQNQAASKQADAAASNAQTDAAAAIFNNGSPNAQQRPTDTAQKKDGDSPKWWLKSEWITIWVALLMVAVGVAQFIMYLCQWRIMRKSLAQTAKIARKQLKHATDSSERGLRAYICPVTSHEARGEEGATIKNLPNYYTMFVKNCGQTPAYNVLGIFEWQHFEGVNVKWPDNFLFPKIVKPEGPEGSRAPIGSGHIIDIRFGLSPDPDGLTFDKAFDRLKKREITVFFYGRIWYDDIFGREHITNFCITSHDTDQTQGNFTSYSHHNEAT